jgi:hypothetical protein
MRQVLARSFGHTGQLPPAVIDAARAELRDLLEAPGTAVAGRQRAPIDWMPAARPFFKRQREYPQGDSNP